MRKHMLYRMTGIIGGWKIIREEIKARTDKEAKSRLKRRYPKIQSIRISTVTEVYGNIRRIK